MPLELNGQPFTLTDEALLRKYSVEMVFTVSKQYIKRNNDPDMRRIETAPVHVPTYYNHFKMENGLRKSLGVFRYYDAVSNFNENGRSVNNYEPQYIAIGHSGVMKSSNPELNFFLDNSPYNEVVKNDSLHPNHRKESESLINTYNRTKRAEGELSVQKKTNKLLVLLLDEDVYTLERMRSLARVVIDQSGARMMVHRLFDSDDMDDATLRSELSRLVMSNTNDMHEIMTMEVTDLTEEVMKWKAMRVVEFTHENEWVFHESQRNQKSIISVPNNSDPVQTLVYFLKNNDPYYKWYKPIAERYRVVSEKIASKKKEKEITE
jgi:hypothetical protein